MCCIVALIVCIWFVCGTGNAASDDGGSTYGSARRVGASRFSGQRHVRTPYGGWWLISFLCYLISLFAAVRG
jgi:hypothetical protein